jgi:hypothetical protein
MNQTLPESQLPKQIAAMSKCYRAEISVVADEKGVYRYVGRIVISLKKKNASSEFYLNLPYVRGRKKK